MEDRILSLSEDLQELLNLVAPDPDQKSIPIQDRSPDTRDAQDERSPAHKERERTLGTPVRDARRRHREMRDVLELIERVREQNELFAAALTAVLLTGMRRSETLGCEFRESDEYLDVMIPTAKQRTDVPPRRCVSYRKDTPGGRILKRIHERFGMPRADMELSTLLGVGSTTSMPFRNLSVQGLATSIRENRREGDKGMTLHTLRHLFATDMRNAGWTERELQRAIGHVNPVNTASYGTE